MANLILWRHAEAEDQSNSGLDNDRALTKNGRKDAAKIAQWLNDYLPEKTLILCSPARRCLETVAPLIEISKDVLQPKKQREVKIAEFLGTGSTVELIAKNVVNDNSNQTILVIGHQPNLGLLIAKLLDMPQSVVVKKGSVWWLRQRQVNGLQQTYLFTVQHPEY